MTRLLTLAALMIAIPACPHPPPAQPGSPSADAAAESAVSRRAMLGATSSATSYAIVTAGETSSQCGQLDQRPCFAWESIPSCQGDLVENLLAHRCVASGTDGALASSARTVATDLRDLLAALGGYVTCFDASLIRGALDDGDATYAEELEQSSCVQRMGAMAHERGYQTLTIGISGGGAYGLGGSVDTGFAFDTDGKSPPTLYQTKGISIGFQVGVGVAIVIGLSKGDNAVDPAGRDTQGFAFEAGAGDGAGFAIWYDYNGVLEGVSVSAIAGAEGKAGAYNRVNTAHYNLNGDNPIVCGADGQRACKLWERLPSCDQGLDEDLLAGMCHKRAPPKALACGAKNQRPCNLWERTPSCNKGLAEDFLAGRCR